MAISSAVILIFSTGINTAEAAAPVPPYAVVSVLEPAGESNVRSGLALSGKHVLVGTEETADVYLSEDGGRKWEKLFDAGDAFKAQDVREMIRAADGSLYASTSGKGDILHSLDGGRTWSLVNSIPAWRTVGIIQLKDGTFLTGARKDDSGETSIYRSEDGFINMERISVPTESQQNVTCFHDLGRSRALAGIGYDGPAKIFISKDSGRSWALAADLEGTVDIFDFISTETGLLASTKSTAALYRSLDKGESWELHTRIWEKGMLGTFARFTWRDQEYLVLAGSDQTDPERFRHCLLISRDGGQTWEEWIELMASETGGASNVTVVDNQTLVVGVGNHSAQGRAFTITLNP